MKLLIPWGLLGLIGIAILIIIYIIKPNYQQKFISSTYVWRLSRKYKKKKLPTSRLIDILIIICQILIVAICSMILAKPSQILKTQTEEPEVIAIIDSSASMKAKSGDETRFQRAVSKVRTLATETFAANGKVSIIIADSSPYFLTQNVSSDNKAQVFDSLDALTDAKCTYGKADLDGAVKMCEKLIESNPETAVYLYTDTNFYNVPSGIQFKRDEVVKDTEWNASILNAYAEIVDNYYNIIIEVACYGRPLDLEVNVNVTGANATDEDSGEDLVLDPVVVSCTGDESKRIVFTYNINEADDAEEGTGVGRYDGAEIIDLRGKIGLTDPSTGDETGIVSFDKITVSISENDSLVEDNTFEIYGGNKNKLNMYYYSVDSNKKGSLSPFITGALTYAQNKYSDKWNIKYTPVSTGDPEVISGYDYYVFENTMPAKLPEDGFVFLVNPSKAPSGCGFSLNGDEYPLSQTYPTNTGYPELEYGEDGEGHPLMRNVDPTRITISKYRRLTVNDDSYKVLMSIDGYPALIYKETENSRVAVLTFSLKYSDWGIDGTGSFALFMNNLFKAIFPSATDKYVYTVGEDVTLQGMGSSLSVTSTATTEYREFPAKMRVNTPGSYTVSQTSAFGREFSDSFFVKIASSELNIFSIQESLADPYQTRNEMDFYRDLLLYFAAALVAILFIEWILQLLDNM